MTGAPQASANPFTTSTTPIDVGKLGTTTPFTLPPAPAQSIGQYDISGLPSVTSLLNPGTTTAQQRQTGLETQLETDTGKLGTKTAAQTAAEDTAAKALGATTGLSDFTGQLTDINNQIQTLQKESAAIPLQIQNEFAGRGATVGGVAPIQAGRLRDNAIKALGLSAIAQTLQGNIASAQQTARRAVELQFAPVQAEIDYLKQAIADNKDNLDREDKQRAEELQVQLNERQRILDQQKQDKSTILSWAAEAAKNGASTLTINNAMSLSDPMQALQVLGPYLSDPIAKQRALVDLENARKQGLLTTAQIAKTNAETAQVLNPSLRPATQAQQTEAGYASRLVQANSIINGLQKKFANANPIAYGVGGIVPGFLQTSDRQAYEQAKRNFVSAVLRQESGAAIAQSEFDNADKQYFPQPGDSPATVQQKQANRELVMRNFINASGSAYEAPPSSAPAQTYTVNGKRYVQGADGLYYPQ